MGNSTRALCAIAAIIFLPACLDAETEPEPELAARSYSCPAWRCGFNAAEVNGRSLRELNLDGLPGSDGVRIVGSVPPPLRLGFVLDVQGDELVFRKGATVLRGAQIVGGIILVQLPGGLPVPVTILSHEKVSSWAEGRPAISAYRLVYPELFELLGVRNVCSGGLLDPVASLATVLGGERYDEASKTVLAGQPRWFTLACAGSAAAKMKLLGYGPQSSATTPAQRQATLKMITADYCGDGEGHTENGTALYWANQDGSVAPPGGAALGEVEAVWTEHGALCLEATRLAGVAVGCALPACSALALDDGEWVTHVVAP